MNIIKEIMEYFATENSFPENNWAFTDDLSSLGLDHQSLDGTKFWLDLNVDGTIIILWKPKGSNIKTVIFTAVEK